ncbi:hypothetical protein [Atlantibacter subterraneus]|uniref:hypothetical protein n=1 Tax=Atlantibacter subterraneus TaxID=255519 RepID=UPI002963F3FC|nr:hypothetical protein [Atlantibacter subterranea]MDW2741477.1 hypothetical protein [Atlantibacter subterranea]
MKSPYDLYIKRSVLTVAIAYGIYLLYGLATTPYQPKPPEVKVVENADTMTQHHAEQPSKPSKIDIFPRIYTTGEVHARFEQHEFRATNDFKNCRLMVIGKIESIGTAAFSKNALVTLSIPGSIDGLNFEFENTNYNNNKVTKLNVGDPIIIAGFKAHRGPLGGIFLDDSRIMSHMLSTKKEQMLVASDGVYDREICQK